MSRAARPTTCPKGYVAGVSVTLTVWCSSHWSRSGPFSRPHTGCVLGRASQESRNGKPLQVQEPETPPTPNCHGCVCRQSVMKCMTSRCAAWFIKDPTLNMTHLLSAGCPAPRKRCFRARAAFDTRRELQLSLLQCVAHLNVLV